jgi:hypothetical protein
VKAEGGRTVVRNNRKAGISGKNRPLGTGRMLADLWTDKQWKEIIRQAKAQGDTEVVFIEKLVAKQLKNRS